MFGEMQLAERVGLETGVRSCGSGLMDKPARRMPRLETFIGRAASLDVTIWQRRAWSDLMSVVSMDAMSAKASRRSRICSSAVDG